MLTAVSRLTESIGDHSARFARSFEGVQEIVSGLRNEGGTALSQVRDVVSSFGATVAQLEGLSEQLRTAAEPLARASESASAVMQTVHQTQIAANEMIQQLESVSSGFKGIDTDLTTAFTAMHSGFERVADDLRRFVTDLDTSFSTALGGVHEVTATLGGGVEDLSATVETFGGNLTSLHGIVEQLRQIAEWSRNGSVTPNGPLTAPAIAE